MLSKALKRQFSTANPESYARIRQYKGPNINVASHNQERRTDYQGDFTFAGTWGMGLEGFSKPVHGLQMHPTVGHRNEFKWLLAVFVFLPIIGKMRRDNEQGMAAEIVANNTYSRLDFGSGNSKVETSWSL